MVTEQIHGDSILLLTEKDGTLDVPVFHVLRETIVEADGLEKHGIHNICCFVGEEMLDTYETDMQFYLLL